MTRVVHFADEYDRFPISHDGVVWSTEPIEWTPLKPVLAALEPQPDPRDEVIARLVEALEHEVSRSRRHLAASTLAALAAAKAVQK